MEPPKSEIKKIIKGTVKKRKTFLQSLIGEGPIAEYIVMDILIPALKNTISEIVSSGTDMLLFGERRAARKDKGLSGGRTSYGSYYSVGEKRIGSPENRIKSTHRFDDMVFTSAVDAEEVLSTLIAIIDTYGVVTVSEFYNLTGITPDWADMRYGWDNLSKSEVLRTSQGYVLSLPKPMPLEN